MSYDEEDQAPEAPPLKWRFQFRLTTLLAVMVPIAVLAAVFRNFVGTGIDPDKDPRVMLFLAAALAAPMLLLVAAGLAPKVKRWLHRRQHKN